VGGEHGQQAKLGGGQCRRSRDARTALFAKLGPERLGLFDQGSEAGPPHEQLIDLCHERPGTREVGEGEVDPDQFEPGLNGEVGDRVGQQMPQTLSTDPPATPQIRCSAGKLRHLR